MHPRLHFVHGRVTRIEYKEAWLSARLEYRPMGRVLVNCKSSLNLDVGDVIEASGLLLGVTLFDEEILVTIQAKSVKKLRSRKTSKSGERRYLVNYPFPGMR